MKFSVSSFIITYNRAIYNFINSHRRSSLSVVATQANTSTRHQGSKRTDGRHIDGNHYDYYTHISFHFRWDHQALCMRAVFHFFFHRIKVDSNDDNIRFNLNFNGIKRMLYETKYLFMIFVIFNFSTVE